MKTFFASIFALLVVACASTPKTPEYGSISFHPEAEEGSANTIEATFNGKLIALGPGRTFDVKVFASKDSLGNPALGFEMPEEQKQAFGDYTFGMKNQLMAIVVGNEVLTMPKVNGRLQGMGVIEGGQGGFTQEEVEDLIQRIRAAQH